MQYLVTSSDLFIMYCFIFITSNNI